MGDGRACYGPFTGPYAWQGTGVPIEVLCVPAFTVAIATARNVLERFCFEPMANLRRGHLPASDRANTSCMTQGVLLAALWGLCISSQHQEWYLHTVQLWRGMPHGISLCAYFYLLYQLSFYIYSAFASVRLDVHRKDWALLVLHHVVTVTLIGYAWIWGFVRVSVVTLVCLDLGVVFFEFAKCSRYARLDRCAYTFFALFVMFWITFRLYYLWAIPIRSAWIEGVQILAAQGMQLPWYVAPAFKALLLVIYLLQYFWFCLILRVLISAVMEPIEKVQDVRD